MINSSFFVKNSHTHTHTHTYIYMRCTVLHLNILGRYRAWLRKIPRHSSANWVYPAAVLRYVTSLTYWR